MKWMKVNDDRGPWAAEIGCGKLSGTPAQNATLPVHCGQFPQLLLSVAPPYSTTDFKLGAQCWPDRLPCSFSRHPHSDDTNLLWGVSFSRFHSSINPGCLSPTLVQGTYMLGLQEKDWRWSLLRWFCTSVANQSSTKTSALPNVCLSLRIIVIGRKKVTKSFPLQ